MYGGATRTKPSAMVADMACRGTVVPHESPNSELLQARRRRTARRLISIRAHTP